MTQETLKKLGSLVVISAFACVLQGTLPSAAAADYYVAPNGTSTGPGTLNQPYSLAKALSGSVGAPGDTFWLRGGTYKLGYLETKIQGAAGKPITFRQMPGELARVDGALSFWGSQGYITLWGFELFSSDLNHISQQTGKGMNPTDINLKSGLWVFVPNMKFINMIIHDHVRHGIYMSEQAINTVVHGCIVYNNGWMSPDMGDGHSFYVQSIGGSTELSDNLAFNGACNNFQIYTDHSGGTLSNVKLDGNVAFNAGISSTANSRQYRNYILGVDSPATRADNLTFVNNMSYYIPGSRSLPQVQIGRAGANGTAVVTNNYLPVGLMFNNWSAVTFRDNFIAPQNSDYVVNLKKDLVTPSGLWNNNTYSRPTTGNTFAINSSGADFTKWKSSTSFDSASTMGSGAMTGTKVIVRPNKYDAGRAHIIVYNWNKAATVSADVSSVLTVGTTYEVRNAQDYFAAPVLTGTYNGAPLQLPMNNLSVAKPNAGWATPPPTGPTFNTFVLIPLGKAPAPPPTAAPSLQMFRDKGNIVVAWPTNSTGYTLQTKSGTTAGAQWTDATATPSKVGDSFMLTNPISMGLKLYRLIKR